VIVDSSILVAVLEREPEADRLIAVLQQSPILRLSAAGLLETCIVIGHRHGALLIARFDALLEAWDVVVEPVTRAQALLAREAFMRFGKGRHPAGLNFGDCFAYALARSCDEPLLCKGDDFARTDLALVAY